MTDKPVIEERENGPLVAKDLPRLTGPDGTEYEVKPVMALCRCGHSANKPFCDGTHNKVGFQSRGGEPAGRDRLIAYAGAQVTILYNPRICSHAGECGRRAPEAFDSKRKPWIDPDKAELAKLEEVVAACPSGALQIEGRGHLVADPPGITIERNGPYRAVGVEIDAPPPGEGASREKFVLCRCGLSGNKPWCDGTHSDKGWTDSD